MVLANPVATSQHLDETSVRAAVMARGTIPGVMEGLGILAAATAIYGRGVTGGYYSDDYQFYLAPHSSNPLHWFTSPGVAPHVYRPLEGAMLTLIQHEAGTNPVPIHLLAITLHASLAWLVGRMALNLGFTRLQSRVATVFLLITQAAAHAVLGIDSTSQIMGTLCGLLATWWLYRSAEHWSTPLTTHRLSTNRYWSSVGMFGMALLSKETSFGFLLILTFVTACQVFHDNNLNRTSRLAWTLLPYVLGAAAYFALRSAVGAAQPTLGGEDRYGMNPFHVANVAKNVLLLVTAIGIPWSTADTYRALSARDWSSVVLIAAVAATSIGMLVWGAFALDRRERRWVVLMLSCAFLSLFPAVLLNHVSELYGYSALPFVAVAVGICVGRLIESSVSPAVIPRPRLASVVIVLTMLATAHLVAVERKASMMKGNGDRAAQYVTEIVPYVRNVRAGGTVWLLNSGAPSVKYSDFIVPEFDVLKMGALDFVARTAHRSDVDIAIVEPQQLRPRSFVDSTVLTLRNGHVVQIHSSDLTRYGISAK